MKYRTVLRKSGIAFVLLLLALCGSLVWGLTVSYYGVSISPDGEIAVITSSSTVSMYRLRDGKKLHTEKGNPYGYHDYQGKFTYMAWSPDGTSLAVAQLNNGVWVWDTSTWDLLTERESEWDSTSEPSFVWSPDGQQLALGLGNGVIWIWNKRTNQWIQKTERDSGVIGITWTNDGRLLMLNGKQIFDVETGKMVSRLDHDIDGHGKVSWSPDGSHIYVFFDLGGGVMDVKANAYEFGAGYFPKFAWSKDGRYFASVSQCSNEIKIWDTVSNEVVKQEKQGMAIYSLAWTPTGDLLALGVLNGQTVLWNTDNGDVLLRLFTPPNLLCVLN